MLLYMPGRGGEWPSDGIYFVQEEDKGEEKQHVCSLVITCYGAGFPIWMVGSHRKLLSLPIPPLLAFMQLPSYFL